MFKSGSIAPTYALAIQDEIFSIGIATSKESPFEVPSNTCPLHGIANCSLKRPPNGLHRICIILRFFYHFLGQSLNITPHCRLNGSESHHL